MSRGAAVRYTIIHSPHCLKLTCDGEDSFLGEFGGNAVRSDAGWEGETLLELLRNERLAALRLGLVLGQHHQHVSLSFDTQLLQKTTKYNAQLSIFQLSYRMVLLCLVLSVPTGLG